MTPPHFGKLGVYSEGRALHETRFLLRALDAASIAQGATILDLGAGNGNAAIPLAPHYDVIAVEPDETMRTELMQNIIKHGVSLRQIEGGAEAIPLPDHSVKAIIAASALHWFKPNQALPEMARVLEPGAPLIAISRLLDPEDALVKGLHALLTKECAAYAHADTTQFSPSRKSDVRNAAPIYMNPATLQTVEQDDPRAFTEKEFVAYLSSVSSLSRWLSGDQAENAKAALGHFFRETLAAHPERAGPGNATLMLPFRYIACIGEPDPARLQAARRGPMTL